MRMVMLNADSIQDVIERLLAGGNYWADFGHPEYKKICFGPPNSPPCFKVLKY